VEVDISVSAPQAFYKISCPYNEAVPVPECLVEVEEKGLVFPELHTYSFFSKFICRPQEGDRFFYSRHPSWYVTGEKLSQKLFPAVVLTILLFAASATDPGNPDTFLGPNPVFDDNSAYCTGEIVDSDASQMNVTVNWSVSSDQVYNETLEKANDTMVNSTFAPGNFTEGQEVLCNVTVFDGPVGSSQVSWEFDSIIAETFDPEIVSGPNFHNYSSEHSFNVSAVVLDREGDDEVRYCRLNATDDDGNSFVREMDIDRTYDGNQRLRCTFSKVENSSEFQVLEKLEVEVWANDSGGGEGNETLVNPIPNSPPLIYDLSPEDGSQISSDSVNLEASVLDRDGEKINVSFYNGSDDSQIESWSDLDSGTSVQESWGTLNSLETYYWYVNASDDHQTVTERLRFRNVLTSNYRVETAFLSDYSAIITSPNRTAAVPYTVRNTAGDVKDLNTSVSGLDAALDSTGSSYETYQLDPGEEKMFTIQISPDSEGRTYLNVATSNDAFNVETVDRIPVIVNDRPTNRVEVPGLGVLQLLVLLLASSTLYYSGRL
jgi:hypothetical protein